MYGWRGRIGLIVPGNNTVIGPDFYTHLPPEISVHTAQMDIEGGSEEGFEDQESEIERCAEAVASGTLDVIVYGVTAGSLIRGVGYEDEIETLIQRVTDVPAIATAASIKRAFEMVGIDSMAVWTPYIDELNQKEQEFLEASGYTVTDIHGMGLDSVHEIGNLAPETVYARARAVDSQDADGVFISCTNLRTFDIIPKLEADLHKPVITSNQATLWDALRTIEVSESGVSLGQLFDR